MKEAGSPAVGVGWAEAVGAAGWGREVTRVPWAPADPARGLTQSWGVKRNKMRNGEQVGSCGPGGLPEAGLARPVRTPSQKQPQDDKYRDALARVVLSNELGFPQQI